MGRSHLKDSERLVVVTDTLIPVISLLQGGKSIHTSSPGGNSNTTSMKNPEQIGQYPIDETATTPQNHPKPNPKPWMALNENSNGSFIYGAILCVVAFVALLSYSRKVEVSVSVPV